MSKHHLEVDELLQLHYACDGVELACLGSFGVNCGCEGFNDCFLLQGASCNDFIFESLLDLCVFRLVAIQIGNDETLKCICHSRDLLVRPFESFILELFGDRVNTELSFGLRPISDLRGNLGDEVLDEWLRESCDRSEITPERQGELLNL